PKLWTQHTIGSDNLTHVGRNPSQQAESPLRGSPLVKNRDVSARPIDRCKKKEERGVHRVILKISGIEKDPRLRLPMAPPNHIAVLFAVQHNVEYPASRSAIVARGVSRRELFISYRRGTVSL